MSRVLKESHKGRKRDGEKRDGLGSLIYLFCSMCLLTNYSNLRGYRGTFLNFHRKKKGHPQTYDSPNMYV